jgi:hypothetical protein
MEKPQELEQGIVKERRPLRLRQAYRKPRLSPAGHTMDLTTLHAGELQVVDFPPILSGET